MPTILAALRTAVPPAEQISMPIVYDVGVSSTARVQPVLIAVSCGLVLKIHHRAALIKKSRLRQPMKDLSILDICKGSPGFEIQARITARLILHMVVVRIVIGDRVDAG
uniref:Uncharacterized protein n=1 Tax=Proboscia inermis TaxID=420281 RepID=A0A7S0GG67_9STRA|mmetsp:Transcript_4556/g.4695  ORF Transcript_4556/g.4695 Transcript_4556/m.4695 type:complete len:109 (+) Transcript_4556:15-341(+)